MTTVEYTKNHIRVAYRDEEMNLVKAANVLVADAELVLVECDSSKEANFWIKLKDKFLKPILISRTEKIEVGDWVYDLLDGRIWHLTNPDSLKAYIEQKCTNWCKILALPEHFSPEQLQDIVDGKLKGKCLVECEECQSDLNSEGMTTGFTSFIIKFNSSNHITIYPVEEKMYTREEVFQIMIDFYASGSDAPTKWFEQNVK